MSVLDFEVVGDPAPQGSKRHVGNGRMIEQSKKVAPWRKCVADAALVAMMHAGQTAPLDGPIDVTITFRLRRPLRPNHPVWPMVIPDIDKLLRSTLDALGVAGVFVNDSRVVSVSMRKVYATLATGAHIVIEAL